MKVIKVFFVSALVLFAAFVLLGLAGAWDPKDSAQYHKQQACTRAWQDAAPGAEKRTARQMCDAMGVKP